MHWDLKHYLPKDLKGRAALLLDIQLRKKVVDEEFSRLLEVPNQEWNDLTKNLKGPIMDYRLILVGSLFFQVLKNLAKNFRALRIILVEHGFIDLLT